MHGENGIPETPEWTPEPRCCPFDTKTCSVCSVAENAQHRAFLLGEAHIFRGTE